jgi:uncharacterized protein (TIGR00730 family)
MDEKMNKKFLCVYCGASEKVDPKYYEAAENLGKMIAENDFNMVYGGGRLGLMGRVSNAVVANGGVVVGVTTEQLDEREGVQEGLHEIHVVDTMHTRKLKMSQRADAFIIMPGGFGTLDEFFEILTWKQLGLHSKPIIIANLDGYWDPLLNLFEHVIEENFAKKEHLQYVEIATSLEDIIKIAKKNLL